MKPFRRLSVVVLLLALAYQAPGLVFACTSSLAQCSTNYSLNESNVGGGGDNNNGSTVNGQYFSSSSTNYKQGGVTVGDTAVGTSQSGSGTTSPGNLLADDFENGGTLSGWTASADGGAGSTGSITEVNTVQHGSQYALFKNTNADPSGGWKSLSSTVTRDWRIDGWIYKPSTGSNNTVAMGIENSSFNGYRFSIDFGTGTNNLAIQKRTGSAPAVASTTLGTAASLALSTNTWYRVIFASNAAANSLTLSVYDNTGLKQLASTTQTDSSVAGSFDRCTAEGGFTYYLDDLNVYGSGAGYQLGAGFNTSPDPVLSVNVTAGSAALGVLSSVAAKTATTTFNVTDYTSYGYIAQIIGTAPISNGHELGHMAGNASTPGTEQFGINLVANTTPATFGQSPQQVPSGSFSFGAAASGYGTPNVYRYNSGDVVAQSLRTSGETDYTVSYVANMSSTTPSGQYSASQTVVCVATY